MSCTMPRTRLSVAWPLPPVSTSGCEVDMKIFSGRTAAHTTASGAALMPWLT